MRNLPNVRPFVIGWSLTLSLVLTISASSQAGAVSNGYSPQIGSTCSKEAQALPGSPTKGGILICLKGKSGLRWQDMGSLVADAHLNSILPKCALDAFYSPAIKVSPDQLKIFTRLATAYFSKRHLLPIKIVQVRKAVKKYMTAGIQACSNGLTALVGAWSGFMPLNASEGWSVYTMHKMAGFGNSLFLEIVKIGSTYKIVGGGTSP